jgi:hypothetical protein
MMSHRSRFSFNVVGWRRVIDEFRGVSMKRVKEAVCGSAILVLVCIPTACTRTPPEPEPPAAVAKSAARPNSNPDPIPTHTASSAAAPSAGPPCVFPLFDPSDDGFSFLDCNEKPGQGDYPECFHYSFEADGDEREVCSPTHVSLIVSGYPGILESYRLRVPSLPAQGDVSLTLDDKASGKSGTVMAIVTMDNGRVIGLTVSGPVHGYHRGKRMKR